jgi:ribose transport system ATP-binding protein
VTQVPLLEISGLTKSFPGVQALTKVSLQLQAGEVLSIVGENGAGKSTLMKILAGVETADQGSIKINGLPTRFANPQAAIEAGVVLIHQELNLCENLDIGQNIFLGREPTRWRWLVDSAKIYHQTAQFLQAVQLKLSPRTLVSGLTIGKRQLVEIAKALSIQARILIFDEPTSSLTSTESEALFELIGKLQLQGVGIIYISHRLSEIQKLSDRVVVLRDGRNVAEFRREEIDAAKLVAAMVGRNLSSQFRRVAHPPGKKVMEVKQLRTCSWPQHPLDFHVRSREVLAIAGLVGSGRSELLQTLFGVTPPVGGEILLDGQRLDSRSPRQAIRQGLALVPEDRKQQGLVLDSSIAQNLALPGSTIGRGGLGWVRSATQLADAQRMIGQLKIKTPHPRQSCKFLSGGNQQKVVLGKWLLLNPKVLLLDEPTRGIDVGAKQEIYQLIDQLAAQSRGVICVSSELEEIIGLADRVLVMREGAIMGELSGSGITEQNILKLATAEN